MMPTRVVVLVVGLSLIATACEQKSAQPPATAKPAAPVAPSPAPVVAAPASPPPGAATISGQSISALGVTFVLPDGWKAKPPANTMRLAQAEVPDASGDPAKACSVVFSTARGGVQPNIDRWAGQVRDEAGQPATPRIQKRSIGGFEVTTVEMEGAYTDMSGSAQPGWALRGAIIETPAGLLFIKMTGPGPAMAAAGPGFSTILASLKGP
jgi:hypothetical protein